MSPRFSCPDCERASIDSHDFNCTNGSRCVERLPTQPNRDEAVNRTDFAAWVTHMKATRRWSAARCSRELGCGVNQIKIWSEAGAPPYIALACAALAFGLPPWRKV